jgi:23S rRNA (guanosine2251-2'-O)-methyltransferase
VADDVVYGQHAATAVLERDPARVLEIWLERDRHTAATRRARAVAERHGLALHEASRGELDRLAARGRHQGIVLRYRPRTGREAGDLGALLGAAGSSPLVLVLDEVQDPHNLGACLRSADAAGVTVVVVPRHRSAGLTPVVRQVAAGGAESVPLVVVPNVAQALEGLREAGLRVVGASQDGDRPWYQGRFDGPVALVLGGEARGLRRLTREGCDEVVAIPMAGAVSSLNVSVACGICLFEVRRQRAAALEPRLPAG